MQNKKYLTASRQWYNYLHHCIHKETIPFNERYEYLKEFIVLGKKLK